MPRITHPTISQEARDEALLDACLSLAQVVACPFRVGHQRGTGTVSVCQDAPVRGCADDGKTFVSAAFFMSPDEADVLADKLREAAAKAREADHA